MRIKFVTIIVNRKKNGIGHILRGNGLLKDVIEGRMERKKVPGSRRMGMLDDLIDDTYKEMKRFVEDRVGWRKWTPRTSLTEKHGDCYVYYTYFIIARILRVYYTCLTIHVYHKCIVMYILFASFILLRGTITSYPINSRFFLSPHYQSQLQSVIA